MSDESPEVIAQRIAERRRAFLDHAHELQERTAGTVNSAVSSLTSLSDAVAKTVHAVGDTADHIRSFTDATSVTEAIRDSVQSIPLTETVQKHPWTCVGGAALAGFLTGMFASRIANHPTEAVTTSGQSVRGHSSPWSGFLDQVIDRVVGEVRHVAQAAIDQAGQAITQRIAEMTAPVPTKNPTGQSSQCAGM